tara:strand:- start:723 stop:1442 length:720 start_codon:yes stop_codon:yes gene_type:complete
MFKRCLVVIFIGIFTITTYAKQYSATNFSSKTLVSDIKKQIMSQIGDVINPEVTVEIKNPTIFDTISQDAFYVFVDLAKPQTLIGKIILDTAFISEDNTIISTQKCLLESSVYGDVYVSNRKIQTNNIISESDITKKRIKLTSRSEDYIFNKDIIIGKQAKRSMIKGIAFSDRWIEMVPDIKKGQNVKLLIKSLGFEIKSDVTALDSGMIGDMIRLKTETKKILRGKVIDKKHILISSN